MRTPKGQPTRNKQICVSVTEELLEQFKKAAALERLPHSYVACRLIEQYVAEHLQQIKAYDEFMAKFDNSVSRQSIRVQGS